MQPRAKPPNREAPVGNELIEKRSGNNPDCKAIRSALNATARIPAGQRFRSCQSVAKEYDMQTVFLDLCRKKFGYKESGVD